MRGALSRIQRLLQAKDEEMSWIDSCCLELSGRSRAGREERFTFQMESPDARKNWIIGQLREQSSHSAPHAGTGETRSETLCSRAL